LKVLDILRSSKKRINNLTTHNLRALVEEANHMAEVVKTLSWVQLKVAADLLKLLAVNTASFEPTYRKYRGCGAMSCLSLKTL
jgi:hypothetical protein